MMSARLWSLRPITFSSASMLKCACWLEALVEEAADLEEFVDRLVDLLLGAAFGKRVDDQSVELGVLRLLHPVMAHQALEQRIDVAVVADRAEIMLLRHPLDHQDDQRHRERIVAEHLGADRLGRADHLALDREAAHEGGVEALEQMDVLGFLAGEVEQGADAPVVLAQLATRMIEQEREDELLDDAEDREILMRADLIEDALLLGVERRRSPPCAPGSPA